MQATADTTKDKTNPGPEYWADATPVTMNIPAPKMQPRPRIIKFKGPIVLFKEFWSPSFDNRSLIGFLRKMCFFTLSPISYLPLSFSSTMVWIRGISVFRETSSDVSLFSP